MASKPSKPSKPAKNKKPVKPKIGRPEIDKEIRKDTRLEFRVNKGRFDAYTSAASLAGCSISVWLRRVADARAKYTEPKEG